AAPPPPWAKMPPHRRTRVRKRFARPPHFYRNGRLTRDEPNTHPAPRAWRTRPEGEPMDVPSVRQTGPPPVGPHRRAPHRGTTRKPLPAFHKRVDLSQRPHPHRGQPDRDDPTRR